MNTDHYIDLCYSKDGGQNWSDWRTLSTGAVGAWQTRVLARRLGTCRQIVFKMRDSSPRRCDILAMSMQISGES